MIFKVPSTDVYTHTHTNFEVKLNENSKANDDDDMTGQRNTPIKAGLSNFTTSNLKWVEKITKQFFLFLSSRKLNF